jgi:hypothetical protein
MRCFFRMGDSMMKTFMKTMIAVAFAVGIVFAQTQSAEAWYRHHHHHHHGAGVAAGIAAGIIGLGIIGAAEADAHAAGDCYRGPRVCEMVEPECHRNRFGDRVCPEPYRACHRRLVCD